MGEPAFVLRPTSQVREEQFGLLFYSSLGPKLLFAETGAVLTRDFFRTDRVQREVLASLSAAEKKIILTFLRQLVEKGFVYEQ
nr:mycofactocin biosynthesis chaperone MftB [uncultured Desulfobacter sp.]